MKPTASIEVTSLSAVDHVLRVNPSKIQSISFAGLFEKLSPRHKDLAALAKAHHIRTEFGARHDKVPEGMLARLNPFEYADFKKLTTSLKEKSRSVVLILDHLQDIQNLGALARTAEALGVDALVIAKDRAAQITGGVYNTSVGAVESIPVAQVANIAEALKRLKDSGYWIVGSALNENAKPLRETPTFDKVALVLGAELEGLSSHVQDTCDWILKIPMKGKIDSLNVSAAGAVLLYFFSERLDQ